VKVLVLASASPARLATLRSAGLDPSVVVSGVEEATVIDADAVSLATRLAELKADTVAAMLLAEGSTDSLVLGCDSVLAFDGEALGKPANADTARARWRQMSGRHGVLHTGHCLVDVATGARVVRTVGTVVHFAEVDSDEIDSYVASGEPLHVAGGFTLDGLGAAFVRGVEGDPHNVVGISVPELRTMLAELGIRWTDLWV